ncbi:sulfite exporter TauE/SafE family protein [Sebaldella sp. S0638]|uniref:sulfite exporter TauE/SafE family protein n=1 Tax=Sebaldella sp. S0638 TaxID=2957809 RepID=UPI00209E99C1|nr:sulfite exporter TauE/SafE family protein [Sebaldella sp. S0638]MCP1222779.1 sulfite exporter TauE/SafE family protein [Sebaldella sp. S0638]
MLYFIISLFSTIIGAIVGIGGGLIIRPLLANIGVAKSLASFTSSIVVMSMAVVTLVTFMRNGVKIKVRKIILLAAGSIIGGFLGGTLLKYVNENFIDVAYIFMLILVLLSVIFRKKIPEINIKNPIAEIIIGIITGGLSGFFGIGGGPFQVTALIVFFGMDPKEAAVDSIFITFLTTLSSLTKYTMNGYMDFSLALFMVPAAIIGGYAGGKINRKISSEKVSLIFKLSILFIILMQSITVIFKYVN